jgi:hypothetical protein
MLVQYDIQRARDNQHGCEGQSTWMRGTINMDARDNQHGCEGQSTWVRGTINMGAITVLYLFSFLFVSLYLYCFNRFGFLFIK